MFLKLQGMDVADSVQFLSLDPVTVEPFEGDIGNFLDLAHLFEKKTNYLL